MALAAGTRLGPYEIVAPLADASAGGAGESYTARDVRLDRTVAIKLLPAQWLDMPEIKERFEREARLLASLNHPNICKLHDVGLDADVIQPYIVMEHLSGETLAARIKRGPVPLDEALRIGIAVADALDAAHRHGVVHRALKPASIMLTAAGPKLIDFGLTGANGTVRPSSGSGSGARPTLITQVGTVTTMGQLQYLAPEQLDDQDANARTDIFALGVVLHEMITGQRAFEGKSQILLISAIATSEPPAISRVQPSAPPALDHIVRTCLAKNPDDRWQTARDLAAELRWIAEGGGHGDVAVPDRLPPAPLSRGLGIAFVATGLLIAALAGPACLYLRGTPEPSRMELRVAPALMYSPNPNFHGFFAISPDGRRLALRTQRATASGQVAALHVGSVDFLNPVQLAGTDDATQPFWSPDGRELGYLAAGKLYKIDVSGGPAQPICDTTEFRGGSWNRSGTIIFGSRDGIFSVPAAGGRPAAVTTLGSGESGHFWPRFLPDGRRFLYLSQAADAKGHALMAGSLDTKERTRIMAIDSNAVFASGYLLFRREGSLYARPFDQERLEVSGEESRIADGVPYSSSTGRAPFDISDNGVIAYFRDLTDSTVGAASTATAERAWQLAWVNRSASDPRPVGKPGVYRGVETSKDGARIAVHRHDGSGGDAWVLEPGGTATKITFTASQDNSNPVWSADGSRLAYVSLRQGKRGLYEAAADGSGQETLLFESEIEKTPLQWSPDGQYLLFWVRDPKTLGDLWVWSDAEKKARPILATEADERHGQISWDGKWLAYSSTLTGRPEIYVQPFPPGGGHWQISPDTHGPDLPANVSGGAWPRWSQKKNELFYMTWGPSIAFERTLFSVAWKAGGSSFIPGPPRAHMRFHAIQFPHAGGEYHTYAVSPDGERFLVYLDPEAATTLPATETPDPPAGISIILNWIPGIRK